MQSLTSTSTTSKSLTSKRLTSKSLTSKIGVATAAAAALVLATALPAHADSSALHDAASDTMKLTVGATSSELSAKISDTKDPRVDITRVTATRSAGTLTVIIRLAKLKKGHVDNLTVLVRTARTKTPAATLLLDPSDPSKSVMTTGGTAAPLPATVTLRTKTGIKGAFVVHIPLDVIGSPAKVSVAATTVHISKTSDSKIVSTTDSTGTMKTTKSAVKWTGFVTD